MIHVAIETGLRWGELIALRPRHLDFLRRTLTVEKTIVEVPNVPHRHGQRMILKPYPKDNEPRTLVLRPGLVDALAEHIGHHGIGRDDLLFSTRDGTPISRNTFRSRVWTPAAKASGIDFHVRLHPHRRHTRTPNRRPDRSARSRATLIHRARRCCSHSPNAPRAHRPPS